MLVLPLLFLSVPTSAAPAETVPSPAEVRKAVERSLPFLFNSSTVWRDKRSCVTCHQIPFALWPLHESKTRGFKVEAKPVDDLTAWSLEFCTTNKNKDEFTGGFLSTMDKMILALETAPRKPNIDKAYEFFIPLIVKYQRPDGSWKEGNFIGVKGAEREGIEADTMWTVLALNSLEKQMGKSLSAAGKDALTKSRQRALVWLESAKPATRTDWVALRMLVKNQSGDVNQTAQWKQELRKRQNTDGGWPFTQGGESHPLVTGEALYALSHTATKDDEAAVRRAWKFLLSTQEKDGSWKSLSRAALGNTNTNKLNEINIHWGTGWATIGLMRTLPPGP